MTRYDVVERFLPYLSAGKKISDDFLLADGVIFFDKYGYVISQGGIGRIRVDDRILPPSPIMWRSTEEVVDAPCEIVQKIKQTSFFKKKPDAIFLRKRELAELAKDLTPKREYKGRVILDFVDGISGITLRKNEIISEKKNLFCKNGEFSGKIEFNLFDFKKAVLEFFSDYDIIGIQLSKNPVMFGRRLDKTKPAIDFVFKEGCCHD